LRIVSYELQCGVIEIVLTDDFADWLKGLRDRRAAARVAERLRRLALGNPGDVKPVGEGVSELRIDYGPGYRVYFVRRGDAFVVVLSGGDKSSQGRDIARAKALAKEV
jgi:putative addiction module killer protein